MNKDTEYKTLKFFEWSFYLGSWFWTVLAFIAFAMTFADLMEVKLFTLASNFYWLTVGLYAASRKIRRHHYPDETHFRKSEFILIFWMIVGLLSGAITIFLDHDKLPIMQELLWMYGILIGILLGGKAIERATTALFGRS